MVWRFYGLPARNNVADVTVVTAFILSFDQQCHGSSDGEPQTMENYHDGYG
jgi:hypothetical protein